jgi:hypothetical protein
MMKRSDRVSTWVLTIGAQLTAIGITVSTVIAIVHDMTVDSKLLSLAVEAKVPEDYFSAGPRIDSAVFTHAEVQTSALSVGVVSWLNIGAALGAITQVIVALSIAYLGWRLLRGDPFRRSLTVTTVTAAVALIVGTGLAALVTSGATFFALQELSPSDFMTERLPFIFNFDITPAIVGVALGVVASAFEYGEKLRSDTQGLV